MYMKLKDGKSKAVTLSYDDGVVEDIRLIRLLDRYGMKATFNINTGMYLPEESKRETFQGRLKRSEAQELYTHSGHEVAVHGMTHPFLEKLAVPQMITEILEDRKRVEKDYGGIVRGMAYPFGTYDDRVKEAAKNCGICYARTVASTENFEFPADFLAWHPTCHHYNPRLMELAQTFIETPCRYPSDNKLFYLWGHSYEFRVNDNWQVIEEFVSYMANREDIWYATNVEIYDYVQAYHRLQIAADQSAVHNPSAVNVWVAHNDTVYCLPAGATVTL